jgi:hypothetical protein
MYLLILQAGMSVLKSSIKRFLAGRLQPALVVTLNAEALAR